MEILRAENVASIKAFTEKSVGSIVLYTNVPFDSLANEKIRVYVDSNGKDNKQITKSELPLKSLILATTYGSDAITSFPANVGEAFETVAVLELAEGGAYKLEGNDKLRIELSGLDNTKTYVIDGIEEPIEVTECYEFEEKIILADSKVVDIATSDFDIAVIDDSNSITEIQMEYSNGRTCTYTRRELRAMSQDIDPIAYVKKDGKAITGFVGILQIPLTLVNSITVKKATGTLVNVLFRVDRTR